MGWAALALMLLVASPQAQGVTLQTGSEAPSTFDPGCGLGPPALELHPSNPNLAFVACSTDRPARSVVKARAMATFSSVVDFTVGGSWLRILDPKTPPTES